MNATELVGAYQREAMEVGDDELDAALGITAGRWRPEVARDSAIQARFPGESIVNVATPYAVCRNLFARLELEPDEVFLDMGCGDGRVLLYGALWCGAARFRGVELVAERVERLRTAASALGLTNVEGVHGNILHQDIDDVAVFYAHRPFSVETEQAVLDMLHREARKRSITVVTNRLQPSLFDPNLFERDGRNTLVFYRSKTRTVSGQ